MNYRIGFNEVAGEINREVTTMLMTTQGRLRYISCGFPQQRHNVNLQTAAAG